MSSRTPSIYSDAPEIPTDEFTEDVNTQLTGHVAHNVPLVGDEHSARPANASQPDLITGSTEGHIGRQRHFVAEQDFGASAQTGSGSQMDVDDEQHDVSQDDMQMQVDQGSLQSPEAVSAVPLAIDQVGRIEESSIPASRSVTDPISSLAPLPATISSATTNPTGRTVSVPVVDEKAQAELRRKIMEIQRDPKISFPEKAGLIQVSFPRSYSGSCFIVRRNSLT